MSPSTVFTLKYNILLSRWSIICIIANIYKIFWIKYSKVWNTFQNSYAVTKWLVSKFQYYLFDSVSVNVGIYMKILDSKKI